MAVLPLRLHRRPAPTIPINHGAYYCGLCWTPPGVAHELSCFEVTPEQFRAFLGHDAHKAPRVTRRRLDLFQLLLDQAFITLTGVTLLVGLSLWTQQ